MKPEDKVIDNDQKPYLMKYAVSAADAYCDPSAIQLSENIFVVWDLQEHGIIIKFRANETKLGEYMYRKTELIDYEHNYPGAKVHAALYKEFREKAGSKFLEQIMPLIKVNDDLFRTYLVGHSLGGAYAQFAALLLVDKFPEMIQPDVYTYGSPRIGNMAFARYAKSQIHLLRVTISNDEIPRYPVRNHLIFGFTGNIYEHSGVEYWIEEPGGPNIIVYRCTPQERSYESKVS
ncbi:hypothetical protein G9A89_015065 [Geosiphon pyriformis]|nr:hypothetical protein G9A89_015065 [Geosiphon pyriformis]